MLDSGDSTAYSGAAYFELPLFCCVCYSRCVSHAQLHLKNLTKGMKIFKTFSHWERETHFASFFSAFVCETRSQWFIHISNVSVLNLSFPFPIFVIYVKTEMHLYIKDIVSVCISMWQFIRIHFGFE